MRATIGFRQIASAACVLTIPMVASAQQDHASSNIAPLACVEVRVDHIDPAASRSGLDADALGANVRRQLEKAGISTYIVRNAADSVSRGAAYPIVTLNIRLQSIARGDQVPLVAAGASVAMRTRFDTASPPDSTLWTAMPPLRTYPSFQAAARAVRKQVSSEIGELIAAVLPASGNKPARSRACA
jgi:hypothetical protein